MSQTAKDKDLPRLQLILRADKDHYQVGETVSLEWTLSNKGRSDIQIFLCIGWDSAHLMLRTQTGKPLYSLDSEILVNQCAFHLIKGSSSYSMTLKGFLKEIPLKNGDKGCLLDFGSSIFELEHLEKVQVSAVYNARGNLSEFLKKFNTTAHKDYKKDIPVLTEKIESPAVEIKIER